MLHSGVGALAGLPYTVNGGLFRLWRSHTGLAVQSGALSTPVFEMLVSEPPDAISDLGETEAPTPHSSPFW